MTVKELIEALQTYPQDARVVNFFPASKEIEAEMIIHDEKRNTVEIS